jgi:UDP-N-acetylglucosamine 2-epimerase (non-hydrolysing)
MRILTVFGTRPEVIKLAPVIHALKRRGLDVILCASGQHREMLDQMLAVFSLRPDFDLNVMQANQTPLGVASRIFEELGPVLERTRPDWLVVQGDTTTVFAASWTSFHWRVPIAHVEAGLRTGNKFQPFPEEMNRRLTSGLADMHFAPTLSAERNLIMEGVDPRQIVVTGNPVVDAVEQILQMPVDWNKSRLGNIDGRIMLVTAHRRENFGPPLEEICGAVADLLRTHSDLTAVLPVHPNPRVQEVVTRLLNGVPRMILTESLAYPAFVQLMQRSELILSDSGGIQEEAPSVGTPVLVLRKVTERPEAVESGWAQLVGSSRQRIVEAASVWLAQNKKRALVRCPNPFGDGHSGERIAELLAVPPACRSSHIEKLIQEESISGGFVDS